MRLGKDIFTTCCLTLTLAVFLAGQAHALSCAAPLLDETAIAQAGAIFEGKLSGSPRKMTFTEKTAFRINGLPTMGGGVETLKVFPMTVYVPWKGVGEGQEVEVLYNTAWGDGFMKEISYLVVSPQKIGGLLWAPLCGNTYDTSLARDLGDISRLERFIGIGHHVRIKAADRACKEDAGCAMVQTHCGGCDCGTPVAKPMAEFYQAQYAETCAIIRMIAHCEIDCPTPVPYCLDGLCTIK